MESLSASLEDYLEAIFHIERQKRAARAKDIADRLSVSRPSVSGALRALARRRLVNHAPYDLVTLTPAGRARAQQVVRRHQTLRNFLVNVLGVNEAAAESCACRIEHAIPDLVLRRLIEFLKTQSRRPPRQKPRSPADGKEGRSPD